MQMLRTSTPDTWIAEVFLAKASQRGGMIRRNVDWVEREVGIDRFAL